MKHLTILGVATAVLGAWLASSVVADDTKTPTIKEVMDKLHRGAKSPLSQVKKELRSRRPDWVQLQKQTKDFVILGAALAKNSPPRGSKASWSKLSLAYFNNAKTLDEAVEAENQRAANAALGKLSHSCAACHGAHKGK